MEKHQIKKLPHRRHFVKRLAKSSLFAGGVILFSLGIGVLGYHHFFALSWVDSIHNASMILGGMGPVDAAPNDSAKLFASFYALYSGVAFLTSSAMLLSPVLHRFLHRFHIDLET